MTEVSGMANIERWLNEWVDRHDAGPDGTDDETLAVFDFIAELRPQIEAADQQLRGAVSDRDALAEAARGVVFAFLAGSLTRADVQPLVHELDRLGGR